MTDHVDKYAHAQENWEYAKLLEDWDRMAVQGAAISRYIKHELSKGRKSRLPDSWKKFAVPSKGTMEKRKIDLKDRLFALDYAHTITDGQLKFEENLGVILVVGRQRGVDLRGMIDAKKAKEKLRGRRPWPRADSSYLKAAVGAMTTRGKAAASGLGKRAADEGGGAAPPSLAAKKRAPPKTAVKPKPKSAAPPTTPASTVSTEIFSWSGEQVQQLFAALREGSLGEEAKKAVMDVMDEVAATAEPTTVLATRAGAAEPERESAEEKPGRRRPEGTAGGGLAVARKSKCLECGGTGTCEYRRQH